MQSPYVWVVTLGEYGQGGSVLGVFRSADAAAAYVERNHVEFVFDAEQPEHHFSYSDGSDWIKIRAHRVE